MALTAFNSRLGQSQGRVVTVDGNAVFVLGDISPGYFHTLVRGDYAQIEQRTDLTSVDLLKVDLRLNVPQGLPDTLVWEMSIFIDSVKRTRTTCTAGRMRNITDLCVNTSKLSGRHRMILRLELVEV